MLPVTLSTEKTAQRGALAPDLRPLYVRSEILWWWIHMSDGAVELVRDAPPGSVGGGE